jgi:hypothetical protein
LTSPDEDFIPAASVRYKPTDEAVTDEDMDIMQSAGEEMVDDIGSWRRVCMHLADLQLQSQIKPKVPGWQQARAGLECWGTSVQQPQVRRNLESERNGT